MNSTSHHFNKKTILYKMKETNKIKKFKKQNNNHLNNNLNKNKIIANPINYNVLNKINLT